MSKKAILSTVFAIALVAVAGFGINKSVKNGGHLSDLTLNNIEALGQVEYDPGTGDWIITCGQYGGRCWALVTYPFNPTAYSCEFSGLQRDYCW